MTQRTINTTLAAAALIMTGITAANASSADNQARFGFGARKDIANGVRLDIATEQRLLNDAKHYYYSEFDLGFNIKVNDWLSVAPALRYKEERKFDPDKSSNDPSRLSTWEREIRPMLNATLSYKYAGWTFEDRNRFEWRQYTDDKKDWKRYRNRVKVTSPWKWTDLNINPYASVEIFQPLSGQTNGKNRRSLQDFEAVVGVSTKLTDDLSLDLYYMAEFKEQLKKPASGGNHRNDGHSHTANIIGVALTMKF